MSHERAAAAKPRAARGLLRPPADVCWAGWWQQTKVAMGAPGSLAAQPYRAAARQLSYIQLNCVVPVVQHGSGLPWPHAAMLNAALLHAVVPAARNTYLSISSHT